MVWTEKYQDNKILIGAFWEILHIQIKKYPQTSTEPKDGAFYLKNEASANGLVLLFQLFLHFFPIQESPWGECGESQDRV